MVLSGSASLPGFLSSALGSLPATKIYAAKALAAASTASTATPARIARKGKCLAIVLMDRFLWQTSEVALATLSPNHLAGVRGTRVSGWRRTGHMIPDRDGSNRLETRRGKLDGRGQITRAWLLAHGPAVGYS